MKSIAYFLIICALAICSNANAQRCDTISYQSMYWADGFSGFFPQKIFVHGDNIFITGVSAPLNTERPEAGEVMLMKLTGRGTPLWCKNIGNSGLPFQNDDFASDAIETKDGSFVFAGYTQADQNKSADGWLAKIDADGTVVWTAIFDSQASRLFKVIELADGSFVAIGVSYTNFDYDAFGNIQKVYNSEAYIVHLDKNGNKLWARSFLSKQLNSLWSLTQLQDGNIVILGETRDNGITDSWLPYLAKLDMVTGDFIWTNGYHSPTENVWQPDVKEMPDHRLCIHNGSNISYFDANGNALSNTFFTLADNSWDGAFVKYIGTGLPGEDYYYAFKYRYVNLFKIKNDATVEWAHQYASKTLPGTTITEMRDVAMANNIFYMNAEIQSQNFPNNTGTNYYPFLLKTDETGNTPCADTLATAFKFSAPAVLGNYPVAFTDNKSPLKPLFRALHSNDVAPHQAKDCYQFSCCTDTLLYTSALVCDGAGYILPNGNMVTEPGVYPTDFKTIKGCDSVIYTTIIPQHKVQVSLGADTCFANLNTIAYKLSYSQQVQYQWQDGSPDSIYSITQPGQYWVRVSTTCNSVADSVVVYADCSFPIYIPSAFTPNYDGLNDMFRVLNLHNQHVLGMAIFNRFGQKIFFTKDPATGWNGTTNGTMQPNGTYIYLVTYTDIAGRYHEQKGTVVLLR